MDENHIKQEYYRLSKEYHPDFYISESEEKQQEVLELSTQNTNAYNTLKNPYMRMEYVLKMHHQLTEGENNTLPQAFLMEMMDLNEEMMALELDPNPEKSSTLVEELHKIKAELEKRVSPFLVTLEGLDENTLNEVLENVKDYYLKRKYLLRIQERLDKFARPNQND